MCASDVVLFSCCSNASRWRRKTGGCRAPSCKTSFSKRESTRSNGRLNRFVITRDTWKFTKEEATDKTANRFTSLRLLDIASRNNWSTYGRLVFPLDDPREFRWPDFSYFIIVLWMNLYVPAGRSILSIPIQIFNSSRRFTISLLSFHFWMLLINIYIASNYTLVFHAKCNRD